MPSCPKYTVAVVSCKWIPVIHGGDTGGYIRSRKLPRYSEEESRVCNCNQLTTSPWWDCYDQTLLTARDRHSSCYTFRLHKGFLELFLSNRVRVDISIPKKNRFRGLRYLMKIAWRTHSNFWTNLIHSKIGLNFKIEIASEPQTWIFLHGASLITYSAKKFIIPGVGRKFPFRSSIKWQTQEERREALAKVNWQNCWGH